MTHRGVAAFTTPMSDQLHVHTRHNIVYTNRQQTDLRSVAEGHVLSVGFFRSGHGSCV